VTRLLVLVVGATVLVACGSGDQTTRPVAGTVGEVGTSTTAAPESTRPPGSTRPAPPPNTVEIVDFAFSPRDVEVRAGETVTWRNEDPYAHWVVSTQPDVLDSGEMSQAQAYSRTFPQAGSYPYYCNIHNYMKATVIVR
jgi:plastocyanin